MYTKEMQQTYYEVIRESEDLLDYAFWSGNEELFLRSIEGHLHYKENGIRVLEFYVKELDLPHGRLAWECRHGNNYHNKIKDILISLKEEKVLSDLVKDKKTTKTIRI